MIEIYNYETVDLKKVGNRIKKIRLLNGLTVEQFAEILNVSENAVYKWQRGETSPDIINFGYISSRFEVSLDYLIMGRGDGDEPSPLDFYGVDGIRTHVPVKANAFRVRPVMTTSIQLHIVKYVV